MGVGQGEERRHTAQFPATYPQFGIFPHPHFAYFCAALKALHILQVTNRIPWPLNDGGNIAVYNLTRHLHRAGHRVQMACLNTSKHRQDPAAITEADAVHTVDIDTSITAWGAFKGLFGKQPYNVSRFWSPAFAQLLQDLLQKNAFDLIQLEGSYLSIYVAAMRAVSTVPIVLRSHNVEFQIWDRVAAHTRNPLKRIYIRNLAGKIQDFELTHLHDYDAIIPIASHDEAFYRAEGYRLPIRTVNGGVDLSAFSPKLPLVANRKVAFLGSLEWLPNVQGLEWFLAKVWPQVHAQHPDVELHVAGKNPVAHLQALQVPGMTFHGMVADAAAMMESCHFSSCRSFLAGACGSRSSRRWPWAVVYSARPSGPRASMRGRARHSSW
jgi:polysaccharide biosynthesis protein PslH